MNPLSKPTRIHLVMGSLSNLHKVLISNHDIVIIHAQKKNPSFKHVIFRTP